MRKRLNIMRSSAKRFRRLALAIAVATAILAIAAATVISRQKLKVNQESSNQAKVTTAPVAANKNYVTVKVAGQNVQVDSQTGQIKELTPEEARKMAAGLKQVINQSSDGLVQVQQPDGSVTMDLDGRFQNVTVARMNEDGTVSASCVDNLQAAGAFFGIDQQLIDDQANGSKAGKQQPRVSTPRN